MSWLQKAVGSGRRIAHAVADTLGPERWMRLGRRYRRIDVEKCVTSADSPPPLHWAACHPSTMSRFKATMTCPSGHVLTLGSHTVERSGVVRPSVVCPAKRCSFHAHVRLMDWTFGEVD